MPYGADAKAVAPYRATPPEGRRDGVRKYTSENDVRREKVGNYADGSTISELWDSSWAGRNDFKARSDSSQTSVDSAPSF